MPFSDDRIPIVKVPGKPLPPPASVSTTLLTSTPVRALVVRCRVSVPVIGAHLSVASIAALLIYSPDNICDLRLRSTHESSPRERCLAFPAEVNPVSGSIPHNHPQTGCDRKAADVRLSLSLSLSLSLWLWSTLLRYCLCHRRWTRLSSRTGRTTEGWGSR